MLQTHAKDIRSRLRLTASVLVVAAAASVTAANAADVTVAKNNTYSLNAFGTNYVVANGITAELTDDNSTTPATAGNPVLYGGNWMDASSYASTVSVKSGGTLQFTDPGYWGAYIGMINADAGSSVVFSRQYGTSIFMGANTFLGNISVADGGTLTFGQDWSATTTYFGTATNFILGTGNTVEFYTPHSISNTISTFSSTGAGSLIFHNGTMIVDGINTAASPFTGTVNIGAGATFMVGDSTHATAVFGDPKASAVTITVNQSGGTLGSLKGYGTIYGSVINNSLVAPGGTNGTPGTLTIRGNYTQTNSTSSPGELLIDVSPTGASKLAVTGTATLAGTMVVKVEDGTYTAPALYDVLTAGSVSGSFSTISVSGKAAFVGTAKSATGYQVAVESSSSAQTFAHQVQANRQAVTEFSRALYDRIETKPEVTSATWQTWVAPFATTESLGRSGLGYSNVTAGIRGGVEYLLPKQGAVVGVAASYGGSWMDTKGDTAKATANTYNVAAYGGADLTFARVDGTLYLSKFSTSIERNLGNSLGTTTASPDGATWGATVQISKSLFHDWVEPYAAGYFARVHLDGVSEGGNANFALKYEALNKNFMVTDLGLRVHAIKPTADQNLRVDFNLAVEHDFSDRGETATAAFANITGSSAVYSWKGDSENAIIAGLDVAQKVTDKISIFARANGQFSTYRRSGDFSVGAKYSF